MASTVNRRQGTLHGNLRGSPVFPHVPGLVSCRGGDGEPERAPHGVGRGVQSLAGSWVAGQGRNLGRPTARAGGVRLSRRSVLPPQRDPARRHGRPWLGQHPE